MSSRSELLRDVMVRTHTTQTALAALSGVRQPSISQFLSGRTDLSDGLLDALLSCMGHRLEVVRTSREADLDRSRERSWRLHRALASHLTSADILEEWSVVIEHNLERLERGARGDPHRSNISRWRHLVAHREVRAIRRLLTGLDPDAIAMREVSPLSGLLSQEERRAVLDGLNA